MLLMNLVNLFQKPSMPLFISISNSLQGDLIIKDKDFEDVEAKSMIIEGTFLLKACLYIALGFFSLHYIDQRKVTDMQILFKFFWVCLIFYVILIITELILTFNYIDELVKPEFHDDKAEEIKNNLIAYFVGFRFIALIAYAGFVIFYFRTMSKYNKAMLDFHLFLSTYR